MKKYLKYWPIAAITTVCLFLLFSGILNNCSQKETTQVVNSVNTSVIRNQVIDSISQIKDKEKIMAIDSLNKIKDQKITVLKKTVDNLYTKLGEQLLNYNEDTLSKTPKCDSIIGTYSTLVDSLNMENEYMGGINKGLEAKITILDTQMATKDKSLDNAYKNIEDLNKELKKSNTWFKRNEKWFYFSAGAILTGLIIK